MAVKLTEGVLDAELGLAAAAKAAESAHVLDGVSLQTAQWHHPNRSRAPGSWRGPETTAPMLPTCQVRPRMPWWTMFRAAWGTRLVRLAPREPPWARH